MKKSLPILAWFALSVVGQVVAQGLPIISCTEAQDFNSKFSKATEIQQALDELVRSGVPGVSMAVYSKEGWWTGNAGLAKIEDKTPMQSCHLQYLQSVSKTYMAVVILQLYEQGKIKLEAPMTNYLPAQYARYITDANKITVRMLLNHTSGIPEYNLVPAYVGKLLQHPDGLFSAEDYLKYIKGKALDFTPGSKYAYRNTNYVVLSLIADAITGDHAKIMNETIFKPLGLRNTYYRNDVNYLTYPTLVNAYWDRHSDGILENASILQRNNVASLVGDDGIVTTPWEAVVFLKSLLEGKLLADSTLRLMQTWVNDGKGNPTYGLGMDCSTLGGATAYGHSGGGIGAGCQLYCFPDKHIYFFVGINLGTVTESPLHEAASKALEKIYKMLRN